MQQVTIAALSTPLGVSALAVVRVSGPDVLALLRALIGEATLAPKPRQMRRARVVDPRNGEEIDDLLYCYFAGPASYTSEDMLELFPHGNPVLVHRLLDAITSVPGVRHALPGEFTRRAFLAGKLDLVQAEAVGQLLHAAQESELTNARRLLSGRLSQKVASLAEQVTRISALLELEVDFAEDETEVDQSVWLKEIMELQSQLQNIIQNFRSQAMAERVPLVVFHGAPNAGKSSLINALVGEDRLLVSPRQGTTRDSVEVHWILSRGEVRLVDTAGLSHTPVDELDAASQERSRREIARADIAVEVLDGTLNTSTATDGTSPWILCNKSDLPGFVARPGTLSVSAQNGDGLNEFRQRLEDTLFPVESQTEDFAITSERQQKAILEAMQGVERAIALLQAGRNAPEELAFELALVRRSLEMLVGKIAGEEILRAIFSRFCIGK